MQFDVLGPLRVVGAQGTQVAMASVAQRRLMSILVTRAGTVVSADSLSEHLDLSPGALRTSVSRLRRIVGFDVLVTEPPGYELRSDGIDARRFEQLLDAAADRADPAQTRAALQDALALWQGDAYGEFAHESWAAAEARRLTELRAGAIEDLAELLVDAGEWTAAIATVQALIDREPFRDRPRMLLMRALADSGRRTDALRVFQTYRTLLLDEVGTEPSDDIIRLDREIARTHDQDVAGESPGVFLMTDIVGSTRRWADEPDAMAADLARHDAVLHEAIADHHGEIISRAGDSFVGAFASVEEAIAAAVAAQTALRATEWRLADGIHVRMGVHLGPAQRRGEGWYGFPLNEAARMMAVAHGGQIVVSEAVAALLPEADLVDLGEHRLRDLDDTRHLFQVIAPGLVDDFPPLRSMGTYVTTLPAQRTGLIGRDVLVARIRRLLREHRLVCLTGPGGVGKTRVAIEASGRELGSFPGGVFFADLTPATDRPAILAALVGGIRLAVAPDRSTDEQLAVYLGERQALLVVDNCEHVIDDIAAVVDELLTAAPDLRVLATSREPLDLHGEHCVEVPSLEVDGPGSAGVRLFTERALAANGDVVIDASGLESVTEIVSHLDGIPLAIELAAARVRELTPAEILANLADRFRLLSRGRRQVPARQYTLEGAVAWSYDLLRPEVQLAFRRLAVCAGPFTPRTAAAVLGVGEVEARDRLDSLVAKSLLTRVGDGSQSQGYRYLETLREYGRRELTARAEEEEARLALETGLLPARRLLGDWFALVNEYICASDLGVVIEDATRREAATHALAAGRLDTAAFIFSSCLFYDEPGAAETTLRLVAPIVARRDELDPLAWRAAGAAKVALERLTRRYAECLETAVTMAAALEADDPSRTWFDMWRCALTTAVAPEAGVAEIEALLPRARDDARAPRDWILSQLLGSKATGLAMLRRLDEARTVAEEAVSRAPIGQESRDQALALLLWILYLTGAPCADSLHEDVAAQRGELGLAELCTAPDALCAEGSTVDRGARLVAAARRRHPADVPTPFLLAFAWLAVEDDDHERAAALVAKVELYDASTQVALIHILATLHGWTDGTWSHERDAAVGKYLSSEQEAAAKEGSGELAAEIERWERTQSHRAPIHDRAV